jgi:predicted transcriptional regulator
LGILDKHEQYALEILEHVDENPQLTNRILAAKLGCSVKLAHSVLAGMVERGLLHVKKLHSRRWDYFLTPKGISEKARLTYEFLNFSMQFYSEARKRSSQVCREVAEGNLKNAAFLGAGELAEITYLGVKEWGLNLMEVYDDNHEQLLGLRARPLEEVVNSKADVIIVCLYEANKPMSEKYLPSNIKQDNRMRWIF